MRDVEDKVILIIAICAALIVVGGFTAIGVWTWQNATDKRACRRSSGTVVHADGDEWHCVGATPEVK